MKRLRNILAISAAAIMSLSVSVGCDKWTEPEALNFDQTMEGSYHGEAYYKNLRAYKASKHTLCFGWFSGWTGVGKPDTRLMGMPDSIDIISLWSGWTGLSNEQIQDLRDVQTIKGTRVIPCLIIDNIGKGLTPAEVTNDFTVDGVEYSSYEEAMSAYWGWYSIQQSSGGWFPTYTDVHYVDGVRQESAPENIQEIIEAAVRKYGKAICDEVNRYGYDGFDIDFEPTSFPGNISRNGAYNPRLFILIDEMSKYLGPQSGTGKILAVDGEPYTLSAECGPKLTYFIIQAYQDTSDTGIDTSSYRIGGLLRLYADVHTRAEVVGKTFLTSDFESGAANGGRITVDYTTRNGEKTHQIYGYAQYYDAETGTRIGGFGAFRFQFDYTNGNNYGYMRTAIQLANPAVK